MYSLLRTLPRVLARARPSTTSVFSASRQTLTLRSFSVSQRAAFPAAAAKSTEKKAVKATTGVGKKKTAAKKKVTKKAAVKKPKRKVAVKKKPAKRVVGKPKPVRLKRSMYPPKRPLSGYMLFAEKYRAGQPKAPTIKDSAEQMKAAGTVWMAMTIAEKEPFEAESREAYKKYHEDVENWWHTADKAVVREINRRRVRIGRRRIHPRVAAEDKRPLTAYNRYIAVTLREMEGVGIQDRMREAAKKWKTLSAEEKSKYQGAAKAEYEAHHAKMAEKKEAAKASSSSSSTA